MAWLLLLGFALGFPVARLGFAIPLELGLPLMWSALTLPLYLEVILLPPNSRVTEKEISSPFTLPSAIQFHELRPLAGPGPPACR